MGKFLSAKIKLVTLLSLWITVFRPKQKTFHPPYAIFERLFFHGFEMLIKLIVSK